MARTDGILRDVHAIAFDLDGTLFNHEGAARAAVRQWIAANGWDDHPDAEAQWFIIEDRRFGEYAAGVVDLQEQRRRRVRDFLPFLGVVFDEADVDDLFAQFLRHYKANWTGFPDALPTLTALAQRGYAIAVLTNGHTEQQRAKLAAIGALDLVDHLLATSELPAFKPDPRAFGALCSALALDPGDVVYVGDDVIADACGARDAGLQSIHLDRSGLAGPIPGTTRIRELAELLTCFP
jgi:putative hydrolase of the HAD superfamily